jgi:hypothetical protein
LAQVYEYELAIPRQLLIGSLSIKEHLDTVFPRQARNTILRIHPRTSYRLFLVPNPLFQVFGESFPARKDVMTLTANRINYRLDVGSLIEAGVLKAGTERML